MSNDKKGRVLAVDDDPLALEAIADALGTLGYEVWQAVEGESALITAREQQPDVILLDVMMPGMDGYHVCRSLKKDPATQFIPVVFLTGQDSREARLLGLEAGAADFLNKPCDVTELNVRVDNLVSFHRLTEELDSAEEIIFTIARAVEARDEDTGDHCDRIAKLSVRLGERLGVGEDDLKELKRGGYLHDLGKVGIPDAVLLKPGKLTEQEWLVMRSHVDIGVKICAPLRTLRPVLPIIRHHHERFDGSGYPDGLSGEEIPYLARIFQVVDIYDALTNDRCYRKAFGFEEAIRIIWEETDRGWHDPDIVRVFIEMIEQDQPAADRLVAATK